MLLLLALFLAARPQRGSCPEGLGTLTFPLCRKCLSHFPEVLHLLRVLFREQAAHCLVRQDAAGWAALTVEEAPSSLPQPAHVVC